MSSYFDERQGWVGDIGLGVTGEAFLNAVADIEDPVVEAVNLVTGDREFPEDLRQRIQGTIAIHALRPSPGLEPSGRTKDRVKACRLSTLLSTLHSDFHEVASRRVETRFGLLGDNPEDILKRRRQCDG